MRNLILILSSFFLINCSAKKTSGNDSLIGKKYEKFNQINSISDYTKISDTVVFEKNFEPKYGILHLKKENIHLIVFNKIEIDQNQKRNYQVLDTLVISNITDADYITIGYCELNKEIKENLIALVSKTDSLHTQNTKKVWMANLKTEKIENLKNLNGVKCLNEFYLDK